jgi:hypothetical protein
MEKSAIQQHILKSSELRKIKGRLEFLKIQDGSDNHDQKIAFEIEVLEKEKTELDKLLVKLGAKVMQEIYGGKMRKSRPPTPPPSPSPSEEEDHLPDQTPESELAV